MATSCNRVTQRIGKSQLTTGAEIFDEVDTSTDITYFGSDSSKHICTTESTAGESFQGQKAILPRILHLIHRLHPFESSNEGTSWQDDLHSMRVVVWGAKRSGKTSIIYRWKLDSFIPTVPTIGLLEEAHEHFNASLRCNVKLNLYEIGRDPVSVEMRAIPIQKEYTDSESDSDDEVLKAEISYPHFYPQTIQFQRNRRRRKKYRDCCATISKCCRCIFCSKRKERCQAIDFAVEMWSKIVKKANAVVYVVDSSCKISLLEMFDDLNMILHNDHLKSQNARFLILANKQDVWGAVSAAEIEKMLNIPRQIGQRCKVMPCSALTGENLEAALMWLEEWMTYQPSSLQLSTTSTFA